MMGILGYRMSSLKCFQSSKTREDKLLFLFFIFLMLRQISVKKYPGKVNNKNIDSFLAFIKTIKSFFFIWTKANNILYLRTCAHWRDIAYIFLSLLLTSQKSEEGIVVDVSYKYWITLGSLFRNVKQNV